MNFEKFFEFNLIVFVALMGSSALALASKLFFNNFFLNSFSVLLELGIIIIFSWFFLIFLKNIFFNFNSVKKDLKNPLKSNLFPSVSIASSLISLMLLKIGLPFFNEFSVLFSFVFWFIALVLSVVFIVVIPINLKFGSKIEHVFGTWFIPPVGLFVLISAGSVLALSFKELIPFMSFLNLLLLGPAFVLYFLTLVLLYFRSKFFDLNSTKLTPTFQIVLAPVGVSILALVFTSKLLVSSNFFNLGVLFFNLTKLFSIVFFGYGLWIILGLVYFYYRVSKDLDSIPFSELWWAFVFPLGAFTLATFNVFSLFKWFFFKAVYLILFVVLLLLWIFVFLKSIKKLIS